jgi:hypothetical protein
MALITAYTLWRAQPFPLGSAHDDMDELHADLATVDTWVADMVVPYVEYGKRFPLKVDVAAGIQRIRARVASLRESIEGDDRSLLDQYAAYLDLLEDVFSAYASERQRGSESDSERRSLS